MAAAYLIVESREQELLLPARMDDDVDENRMARVIGAFVDDLCAGEEEAALPPLREMGRDGGRRGYHPADIAPATFWTVVAFVWSWSGCGGSARGAGICVRLVRTVFRTSVALVLGGVPTASGFPA